MLKDWKWKDKVRPLKLSLEEIFLALFPLAMFGLTVRFNYIAIKKHIMRVTMPRTTYKESTLMLSFLLLYMRVILE